MQRRIVRANQAMRHQVVSLSKALSGISATSPFALALEGLRDKVGQCRVVPDTNGVMRAVVGTGDDPSAEDVRRAVSAGVRALRPYRPAHIQVDPIGNAQAAAEGASLSLYAFSELKNGRRADSSEKEAALAEARADAALPELELGEGSSSSDQSGWDAGIVMGDAQNWSRRLAELPSNLLTPDIFSREVDRRLGHHPDVEVTIRDERWIRHQGMGGVWSVGKGSAEPPRFLEVHFRPGGSTAAPVVLVGKAVTFDTGGYSIKPSANMGLMRGDMGGAAAVVGALDAAIRCRGTNPVVALIPMAENMVSGKAYKPSDIVVARNGLTIEADNTDAEGRLLLGDALDYAHEMDPRVIIDLATLTGAMDVALGRGAAGAFTGSDSLWDAIHRSGEVTGERMWRMPLWDHYRKAMDSDIADLCNAGGRSAGACTAAAFLKEFVRVDDWMHIDIAGVMHAPAQDAYMPKGMTGAPARMLAHYLLQAPDAST